MKPFRKDAGILSDVLGRWQRGIARACRWRHDGAAIAGRKRGLCPVIQVVMSHWATRRTVKLIIAFVAALWLSTPTAFAAVTFQAVSANAQAASGNLTVTP